MSADLIEAPDLGRIAPSMKADIIGVPGNPLDDIRTMEDVLLVVNNGKVVLNRLTW